MLTFLVAVIAFLLLLAVFGGDKLRAVAMTLLAHGVVWGGMIAALVVWGVGAFIGVLCVLFVVALMLPKDETK